MIIFIEVVAFIFGAILGSFACCQARRLRLSEKGKKDPGKWSVCLACGKKLTWYENIPVISWLIQGGKCRKCHKKIGATEFLAEIFTGFTFVAVIAWYAGLFSGKCGVMQLQCSEFDFMNAALTGAFSIPAIIDCLLLLILAAVLTSMVILFIYDAKWQVMPTFVLVLANILAVIFTIGRIAAGAIFFESFDLSSTLIQLMIGIAILPGLYYLMYVASKETLVGGGDWILALAIALILGNWWLALLVLFLSNAIASLVMLPFSLRKKQKQICFGPFLIIAFLIVLLGQSFFMMLAKGILL